MESVQQAEAKAVAALKRANSARVELDISAEGNVLLSAGVCVTLTGLARLSGKYLVDQVRHAYARNGGYRSQFSARKV